VEVLKGEKDRTQDKLEKLHAVLEKERGALRDVLQAARKAVDDLKEEKQVVEDELERLKKLLAERGSDSTQQEAAMAQLKRDHENEIEKLQIEISRLKMSLVSHESTGSNNEALEKSLRAANATIDDLRSQLAEAQRNANRSREDGDRELARLRQQLEEARRSSQNSSQDDMDQLKQQMDAQFRRLQMRLASTRKESGTRWMNQILGRWRLHHLVSFLHYWRATVGSNSDQASGMRTKLLALQHEAGLRTLRDIFRRVAYGALGWAFTSWKEFVTTQDALSELEEQKNEELRQQLAQAGRGLKRWMEERENANPDIEKLQAQMKLSEKAAELTEKALEAERAALQKQLADCEAEKASLEADLQEALQVLERGMADMKKEKAEMDEQRANFLKVMREAEKDRKEAAETIAALKAGGGDVSEERRQKLEWKREAERTAELFDEKKIQFDLALRDAEFKQGLLKKQLSQLDAENNACKEELFQTVGDLAHLQNETDNTRTRADETDKRNQQLENLVSRHVVEGAVLSGFLLKQGAKMASSWHQRWCILDGAALSLYTDRETRIAKTIIPLMKVASVAPDPSARKFCLAVKMHDGSVYRFDAETDGNMKEWLDAIEQMRLSAVKLSSEWDEIKEGYSADVKQLRDKILVLEQELTDVKVSGSMKANEVLKRMQNKFEVMEMSLGKIDDDLWFWIERNMWQTTTVQNMGFGSGSRALAVGAKPVGCETVVTWTGSNGNKDSNTVTQEHCFAASDHKEVVFTVNFAAPAGTTNIQAVVNVQNSTVEVHVPPPVPQQQTAEVKKLQRLMTLRNPSPPRSRSERRGAADRSPRGKSPPKGRTLKLT
jgi:hypothetical protein